MKEVSPYSKETQLRGHQKEKSTPKFKNQRHNRRRKKPKKQVERHQGVKIPHRKQRAKIHPNDYAEALREWGECCTECGSPYIQMHHVMFRSQHGRGGYRNLHPLCESCHTKAHRSREFADKLRDQHEKRYGRFYFYDKYDAWKAGYISSPEQDKFEEWMEESKHE